MAKPNSFADDLKQDYRKLQQNNLQLKRERQSLLEKVARMEKRANKYSVTEVGLIALQPNCYIYSRT